MSGKLKACEVVRSRWWKHLGIAALILAGTLAVVSAARHALRPSGPPLPSGRDLVEYHPPQVHVTTAPQLELSLAARNPWNEPVRILKTVSACSCSVVEFPQEAIAPGQELTFRLRVFVPPAGFPSRRLDVTFLLDRQRSWTHQVVVRALRPVVVPNPEPRGPWDTYLERLDFGTLKLRQSVERRWSIQGYAARADQVPQVLELRCRHPRVKARLLGRRRADASDRYLVWTDTLLVRIDTADRPGAFAADVELHGRLGQQPFRKHLYVTWQVEPVFRWEPEQVVFILRNASAQSCQVRFRRVDGRPFVLAAPRDVPPWLSLQCTTWHRSAVEHQVVVQLRPDQVPGDTSCRLRFRTDRPRQPEIELPCAVAVVND